MKVTFVAALLGLALLAIYVTPTSSAPTDGCGGGEEVEKVGGGGGSLLDVEVFLGVDFSGLGNILNRLLGVILLLPEKDKCEYPEMAEELEGILLDLILYIKVLGIKVQLNLLILLGPLLQAVLELISALLRGLLIDLSVILNLVLNLLVTLNLELDAEVAIKLGKLLKLDVLALVNLG